MKRFLVFCLYFFTNCVILAQNKDIWISFWDKDTTHIGFKDANGTIKITPKFMGFTTARKFDKIIAVTEEINGGWKSYYLTKSGKIVGRDSLYIFDNGPDCENEGYIRFTDRKTDKTGMFNSEGKIAIPADYSVLSKVQNGMIVALKGALKKQDGEHFFWTGGERYLIDLNNKVLIEDFKDSTDLNFYSLQKSKAPNKEETRENFAGVDGEYYSFINYDKKFRLWLKNNLLSDLSKENLMKISFDKITYWKEPIGWKSESKTKFIEDNYALLKSKLQQLKTSGTDYFVSSDGLNPFIFETSEYNTYFNNCNEPKEWMYPVKNIVINSSNKTDFKQDHFEFLRTEKGYKLISVSVAKDDLK
ncbi:hypothetical protein [Flavobacterium sp. B183]|uniref:hypothetical protein n=1 Tax=Flavobacterium sp. B183 TaxID=907046 RepID=UPI00201F9E16|nr:hypothetical protein [Flavobacterium sp. B183]URC14271.1 hypothetical protein M4I44_07760 [Flavobacterium sp. B183]